MNKIVCRIDERCATNMQLNRNFLPLSLALFSPLKQFQLDDDDNDNNTKINFIR